jgi:hypothetical protein
MAQPSLVVSTLTTRPFQGKAESAGFQGRSLRSLQSPAVSATGATVEYPLENLFQTAFQTLFRQTPYLVRRMASIISLTWPMAFNGVDRMR